MLSLRRTLSLRYRGLGIQASSSACADLERTTAQIPDQASLIGSSESASNRPLCFNGFYRNKHSSANLFLARRGLASHAGTKSGGEEEDELDEGFSELEIEDSDKEASSGAAQVESEEDVPVSEPEFSDDDDDVAESCVSEQIPSKRRCNPTLLKAIIDGKGPAVPAALTKWVEDGNVMDRDEASLLMSNLRKFRMYGKALQFSEWLELSGTVELEERYYSSRLDLVAKIHGLEKAEKYVDRVPESFRGELIYRTLLASCGQTLNFRKAEEIFSKIKNEFTLTDFACNQMILLYKRTDSRKIADVLLLMEKENVKPSKFTYRMLVDIKGQHNDIHGMEQVLETMKAEGVVPDTRTYCVVAKHYATAGLREKAEAVARQIEGDDLKERRGACRRMIVLYGELGLAEEVERVWKVCESDPWPGECMAAVEAWGSLKNIEKAEEVFERMLKMVNKPSSVHYNALLKVYTSNKMLEKGKGLIKQMSDGGCQVGPVAWDSLVRLYLDAGEVWKADSVLQKAGQQGSGRPMFTSYMAVMEEYARKGDVHNAEKIFHRMRESGYQPRGRQFHILVKAYVNAKTPPYGMRERMKADNVFPNQALLGQMHLVDAFRKTPVSDLLE